MATIDKRTLKAYVRLDGQLRVVPTSLILRKNKPKVGRWVEVPAWECCTGTTTTTQAPQCATYIIIVTRGTAYLSYTDCDGTPRGPFTMTAPVSDLFCCLQNSYTVEGTADVYFVGYGCSLTTTTSSTSTSTTTSTTTAAPTTTTTTTTEPPVPSDILLKDNLVPTGEKIGEFDEYTWEWNELAVSLGLSHYPTKGVLAQDVMKTNPDAVTIDEETGYYKVNYNLL